MEQIDLSSIIMLPHSYPSVPSGVPTPIDPYAVKRAIDRNSWAYFPVTAGAPGDGKCRLLALPLELREQILSYALPYTFTRPKRATSGEFDVVWHPGCTSIMAASKQLHNECARLLYSEATFDISVWYSGIKLELKRLLPSGLVPKRDPNFEQVVRARYHGLLKKVRVRITVEDDYSGMIRYNCGGRGLPAGVGVQVQRLVAILHKASHLQHLEVQFLDYSAKKFSGDHNSEIVLAPFFGLSNVKHSAWSGIPEDLATRLSQATRLIA